MRDTNIKNNQNNKTDDEVFDEFKTKLKSLTEMAEPFKVYFLHNHIGILYKNGFLEVYNYDRPVNPRLHGNRLSFDYYIAGERHEIQIILA